MADIYDEINDLEFEVVTMTDENAMQWSFPSLIMLPAAANAIFW